AHAAARLQAGRRVWASADVHSSAVWLRREAERCAAAEASEWPRLLTSAEEWLLWREYAAAATRRFALVNGGALAQSLQHSSELAAHYGIAPRAGAPDSEATVLCEAQQVFDERCRSLRAASVGSLLQRIAAAGGGRALLLRGFDSLAPRLRAIEAARQPLAQLPMIAHALTTLEWLAGREGDFEAFSRWLRAPHWSAPSAAARARLDLTLRERAVPSLRLRELLGGLRLAAPQLQAAAREFSAQLTNAAAALGEGSGSPRAWSERFAAALTAA